MAWGLAIVHTSLYMHSGRTWDLVGQSLMPEKHNRPGNVAGSNHPEPIAHYSPAHRLSPSTIPAPSHPGPLPGHAWPPT